jgi:hypothetical protein
MQPTVAKPRSLRGELSQATDEHLVVGPSEPVAARRTGQTGELARATLAVTTRLEHSDDLPSHGGRHHFFPKATFSESTSSAYCATSFFSLAFSSSEIGSSPIFGVQPPSLGASPPESKGASWRASTSPSTI